MRIVILGPRSGYRLASGYLATLKPVQAPLKSDSDFVKVKGLWNGVGLILMEMPYENLTDMHINTSPNL